MHDSTGLLHFLKQLLRKMGDVTEDVVDNQQNKDKHYEKQTFVPRGTTTTGCKCYKQRSKKQSSDLQKCSVVLFIQVLCRTEHIKLHISLVTLVIHFILIIIVIQGLPKAMENKQNYSSQRQKFNFKSDFCVHFASNAKVSSNEVLTSLLSERVLHCFHNTDYLRYLFHMMVAFRKRRVVTNQSDTKRNINQGFVRGDFQYTNKKSDCFKPSTKLMLKNVLDLQQSNRLNKIMCPEDGMYMVYIHLTFVQTSRCTTSRTDLRIKYNDRIFISDSNRPITGLLVYQPKIIILFLKIRELKLMLSETSNLESQWQTNVIGLVRIS